MATQISKEDRAVTDASILEKADERSQPNIVANISLLFHWNALFQQFYLSHTSWSLIEIP